MRIEAYFDESTSTLTYLLWDPATKDALIIDPVLDFDPLAWQTSSEGVDRILAAVKERQLNVRYILETHAHADHLTGAQLLKAELNVPVVIGSRIREVQRTFKLVFDLGDGFSVEGDQFDKLVEPKDRLEAGSLSVEVIATPGHTPACVSYKIGDAVFTGDALFMEDYGTGRADFPNGSSAELYESIHERLYSLPDETRVFVGHDYLPDGRELKYETTIGRSKLANKMLKLETTKEEFVGARNARDAGLPPPKLIYQSLQVNANGGMLPSPSDNGVRYLRMPLNRSRPTDASGAALVQP